MEGYGWLLGGGGIGGLFLLWLRTKAMAKSDSRKEDRTAIDVIIKLIDDVETICYDYYGMDASCEAAIEKARRARALIQQIARKTNELATRFDGHQLTSLMVRFRQAATTNLDDTTRKALPPEDPIYQGISDAGRRLGSELERVFKKTYK